jgi:hypothetical protein
MQGQQRQNGSGFGVPDKTSGGAGSMQDLYDTAVDSEVSDEFLDSNHFGLGNYTDSEMWQQIQSNRRGIYAEAGLQRLVFKRAVYETKLGIAREGWQYRDEDGNLVFETARADLDEKPDDETRGQYLLRRGSAKWGQLDSHQQVAAIEHFSGISSDWTSPFRRMMLMRHEASRSRGARLLDNLFGRVRKMIEGEDSSGGRSWLPSRGGDGS